jgi:hypothetical protein
MIDLTENKAGILYMKPTLHTVVNCFTMLNLGCDCGGYLLNKLKARISENKKKHGRLKRLAPIKVQFDERGL